jgi:hypothetical protein
MKSQGLLLAVLCLCGCTSVKDSAANNDVICSELAKFAGTDQLPQSVILRGGWGGDTPGTLRTHDCKPQGGAEAKEFCSYLAENTSWEFGRYTVDRVAACFLEPRARRAVLSLSEASELAVASVANPWNVDGTATLKISFVPTSGTRTVYRFEMVANAVEAR